VISLKLSTAGCDELGVGGEYEVDVDVDVEVADVLVVVCLAREDDVVDFVVLVVLGLL